MIICSHCGRENEDHYKFCLGCGSPLSRPEPPKPVAEPQPPKMIPCPHCGTPVPSNFKFCGACGGPIAAASPAPAETPPPYSGPAESSPLRVTQPRQDSLHSTNPSGTPVASGVGLDAAPSTGSTVARLVVIRPDGSEGATIPLREGEITIGRNSEQEVLASDPFLDPNHARVTCKNGQFTIEDLTSLNGVFLRIKNEQELESGDYIRLGQELLQFHKMGDIQSLDTEHTGDAETLRGGSPDVGYWGRLSLISGPDLVSRSFCFSDDEVNIGREIGDIVFRDDGFVSGRHARLTKVDNRIILKDLGSSNGTYIRIKKPISLQDGDLILMGQQLFRLVG